MHLRNLLILVFFMQTYSDFLFSQSTLKDIVLSYDLKRTTQTAAAGRYPVHRPQLVHIEPICEDQSIYGNYCGVLFDLKEDNGSYKAGIKLVHKDAINKYFKIEKAYICDRRSCPELFGQGDFILAVELSRSAHLDSATVLIHSSDFIDSNYLGGIQMDVHISAPDSRCSERRNPDEVRTMSPPWVCRFIFE